MRSDAGYRKWAETMVLFTLRVKRAILGVGKNLVRVTDTIYDNDFNSQQEPDVRLNRT